MNVTTESQRDWPGITPGSRPLLLWALLIGVVIPVAVAFASTPYMAFATLAYLILFAGIMLRKTRKLHAAMMSFGMGLDIALVLTLEMQRQAVQTAAFSPLSPYQYGHIGSSALAVVLYAPVAVLGAMRLRGRGTARAHRFHGYLGGIAMIFRTIGFISMFSMLGVHSQ
jgi:hypothetical protein